MKGKRDRKENGVESREKGKEKEKREKSKNGGKVENVGCKMGEKGGEMVQK